MRIRNGPATVTRDRRGVRTSAAPVDRRSAAIGRPHVPRAWTPRRKGKRCLLGPSRTGSAFPFSAIVASEDLALALILTTVSPHVGGVLVRGEKGTAKTTMVRAVDPCPARRRGGRGLPIQLRSQRPGSDLPGRPP